MTVDNDNAKHLGVMHWKDDTDKSTISTSIDEWENVKTQTYALNDDNAAFVTGARFAF